MSVFIFDHGDLFQRLQRTKVHWLHSRIDNFLVRKVAIGFPISHQKSMGDVKNLICIIIPMDAVAVATIKTKCKSFGEFL